MAPSRFAVLAADIQVNATKLDEYFTENGLPPPSFDENAPLTYAFPPDIAAAQEALSASLDELWWLNQGPIQTLFARVLATSIGLKAITKYNIHHLVPLDTGTTFRELAEKTGLPEKKLTRLLRQTIAEHLFLEPRPGFVKHSVATKALVTIPSLPKWIEMWIYEGWSSNENIVEAMEKWPDSEEPNHSGFNIANNTDKTAFELFKEHPDRESRFKTAMTFLASFPGMEVSHVVNGFDWASLGEATIVDVGGSHGKVGLEIAEAFPNLRIIVQDLPEVIETEKTTVPPELADRVSFMSHDFFTEQPVKDAKVYFFRFIFHDWSEKYCIKILRALIPALRSGDKIIINDRCLAPPCTLPLLQDKWNRDMDIAMMSICNAQERDEDDFKQLIHAADPRFKLQEIKKMKGARMDLVVVEWE